MLIAYEKPADDERPKIMPALRGQKPSPPTHLFVRLTHASPLLNDHRLLTIARVSGFWKPVKVAAAC